MINFEVCVKMSHIWFKKAGWAYRPISIQGWVITLFTVALCVQVFVAVDGRVNSVSDLFYGVFPYIVAYLVVAGWIDSNTTN